ncbi:MAG TPA: alpha-E domain-containing protein [Chloroflexota bacterium]|nr:alpha-E domain-containing protein [Chloroflexota bacterium]
MLCRVAENLYWMGRYLERGLAVARLIDVIDHLELDAGDVAAERVDFWTPLLGRAGEGGFLTLDTTEPLRPAVIRRHLAIDPDNPTSVLSSLRHARAAAREIRECISSEMWERLNSLYLSLLDPQAMVLAEQDSYGFCKRMQEGAQLVQGLADNTLAHDEPWHFISLGKWLERADTVTRVLYLQAPVLIEGTAAAGAGEGGVVRWLAVLRSCACAEAYARHYSLRVEPARVVEFLLLNPVFPQSVRFSLGAAWDNLRGIISAVATPGGNTEWTAATEQALGLLRARLDFAAVDEVFEEGLSTLLLDVQRRIALASDRVTRSFFLGQPQPVRLAPATRAAMIMAAQQQ